jgi:hypothetical protein
MNFVVPVLRKQKTKTPSLESGPKGRANAAAVVEHFGGHKAIAIKLRQNALHLRKVAGKSGREMKTASLMCGIDG